MARKRNARRLRLTCHHCSSSYPALVKSKGGYVARQVWCPHCGTQRRPTRVEVRRSCSILSEKEVRIFTAKIRKQRGKWPADSYIEEAIIHYAEIAALKFSARNWSRKTGRRIRFIPFARSVILNNAARYSLARRGPVIQQNAIGIDDEGKPVDIGVAYVAGKIRTASVASESEAHEALEGWDAWDRLQEFAGPIAATAVWQRFVLLRDFASIAKELKTSECRVREIIDETLISLREANVFKLPEDE